MRGFRNKETGGTVTSSDVDQKTEDADRTGSRTHRQQNKQEGDTGNKQAHQLNCRAELMRSQTNRALMLYGLESCIASLIESFTNQYRRYRVMLSPASCSTLRCTSRFANSLIPACVLDAPCSDPDWNSTRQTVQNQPPR